MASSRYPLRSRKTVQNPSEGNKIGESVSGSLITGNTPEHPPGLPIPAVPISNRNGDPVTRPATKEDLGPQSGVTAVDSAPPLDTPRPNPQVSLSRDASDANVEYNTYTSTSINKPMDYDKMLSSMSELSISSKDPDEEHEVYESALFSINPLSEPDSRLSESQLSIVNQAAASLSNEQLEAILRRNSTLGINQNAEATGSKDKGKGVDPRNWGNIDIPEHELNAEAQQRALKELKDSKRKRDHKRDKRRKKSRSRRKSRHKSQGNSSTSSRSDSDSEDESRNSDEYLPGPGPAIGITKYIRNNYEENRNVSLRPNQQKSPGVGIPKPIDLVNPKSYLGVAFNELRQKSVTSDRSSRHRAEGPKPKKNKALRKKKRSRGKSKRSTHRRRSRSSSISVPVNDDNSPSDSSSSSSSDTSSNSEDSDDSNTSSSESRYSVESNESKSSDERDSIRSQRKSHRSLKSRPVPSRSLFKPIPPEKYDGTPEVQKFFRFMKQADEYLTDGHAPPEREVTIISKFLTGKAYDFYLMKVSMVPKRWRFHEFAEALFNHCFPADFRSKQRARLTHFKQRELTVREYMSQLFEFFIILDLDVDNPNDHLWMVDKCWRGLRLEIQEQLWMSNLNPEMNSLEDVRMAAERIEMAQSIASSIAKRGKPKSDNNKESKRKKKSKNKQGEDIERSETKGKGFHKKGHKKSYGRKTNQDPNTNTGDKRRSRSPSFRQKKFPKKGKKSSSWVPQEEWDRRRQEGKCLRCGGDHMTRQCPESETVASSSRGPPGIRSNNLDVSAINETEKLRALAETTECSNLLELGAVDLDDDQFSKASSYRTCPESAESNWELSYEDPYLGMPELDLISNSSKDYESLSSESKLSRVEIATEKSHLGKCYTFSENGEWISVPESSPMFEIISNESEDLDSTERVADWLRSQYRDAVPSEVNEENDALPGDEPSRLCTGIKALGEKGSKEFHDREHGKIGDLAQTKLERIFATLMPRSWGPPILRTNGNGDRINVLSSAWGGHLKIQRKYILSWKSSSLARYILRKVFLAARQGPVPRGMIDIIDELSTKLEVNDDILGNAEFILNSKLGFVDGHYPSQTENEYVYTYRTRFLLTRSGDHVIIYDVDTGSLHAVGYELLSNENFDLVNWWLKRTFRELRPTDYVMDQLDNSIWGHLELTLTDTDTKQEPPNVADVTIESSPVIIEMNGQQVKSGTYPSLQRNASHVKDVTRPVPKPLVVVVKINGHPARALVDSGSLGDFVSSNLAQQLGLSKIELASPLQVQMAVQGSRSKVNYGTRVNFEYQGINEERYLDVINLSNYDVILGTPFMYQHRISMCLEPPALVIGSDKSLPLSGPRIRKLESRVALLYEDRVQEIRNELLNYAKKVCLNAADTPLPPLREINHEIPLIDPTKRYSWRPSKCPDALLSHWVKKKETYVRTGRWKARPVSNAVPMLLIPKPRKPGEPLKLRTVIDLRERNANTRKLSSPLPDIDSILRKVASSKYRSTIDLADAYEQIRVIPEHVERTAMATPSGTMISEVMQQGDCNASATFQMVMTHFFAPYIGDFLEVYLDDIIIFSNTLEEHIRHVKLVIDTLDKHKFYVSEKKLHFLEKELNILGRVVDDQGIRMDSDKVDALSRWKTPTNRDLLRGFLGSAGYLADDIDRVRIPMGILTELTGDTVPFRWEYTHQRAFDDIKAMAVRCKDHHRKPLTYGQGAPPINVVTDGCVTGVAGVVSQGDDWKTARVAAFYSAKLNPAQQNYPVHEIEMLAGLETMLRHRDILHGTRFRWFTDHKGLVTLLQQKDLSGRQARWMEKLSQFDFEVIYVPGTDNILSDALSRLYSNEKPGTVRAASEYTYHDVIDDDDAPIAEVDVTRPVFVNKEAEASLLSIGGGRIRRRVTTTVEGGGPGGVAVSSMSVRRSSRLESKRIIPLPQEGKEGAGTTDTENSSEKSGARRKLKVSAPTQMQDTSTHAVQDETQKLTIRIPPRKDRMAMIEEEFNEDVTHVTRDGDVTVINNDNANEEQIPSLTKVIRSFDDGLDLIETVRGKYEHDSLFRDIINNPKEHKNFVLKDNLLYIRLENSECLCIPDVTSKGRKIRELVIAEAHSLLAHLGSRKTLLYLRDHVWWKTMAKDVAAYCDSCITCKRSKPSNHKPYGLLKPLDVPTRPWENIGIDFVGPLPESKNRNGYFDTITVVIDRLTGMVHLLPSRQTFKAKDIAELLFSEIYRLHGIPKSIVSDRDTLFNSTFWRHLHELIGTKLHMSSAYHPESDGSTERANRTITQMLRQCISPDQKDWVTKLPAVEFAINSARSEVTGYAPFFLNYGRMPRSLLWDSNCKSEFPGIRKFAQGLKLAIINAHDSILAHRVKEIRTANRKRLPSPFDIGDLVYISSKNITFPKGLARKLVPKFIGPYPITHKFGSESYRVGISKGLRQRGVHDVFHASLLRIHVANDDRLFPGRLDSQIWESDEVGQEWSVQSIKSHTGQGKGALFEIIWKSGDTTWLPYHKVDHLNALTDYFEALGIDGIENLGPGRRAPDSLDDQVLLANLEFEFPPTSSKFKEDAFAPPSPIFSLLFTLPFITFLFHHTSLMPKTDWKPPRELVKTLRAKFPFIYANEPTIWMIRDLDTNTSRYFSPALFRIYNQFDNFVREGQHHHPEPIGYSDFASVFNKHPSEFGYSYRDSTSSEWITPPNRRRITHNDLDLIDFALAKPASSSAILRGLGVADKDGHISNEQVETMTRAIFQNSMLQMAENPLMQQPGGRVRTPKTSRRHHPLISSGPKITEGGKTRRGGKESSDNMEVDKGITKGTGGDLDRENATAASETENGVVTAKKGADGLYIYED